MGHTCDGYEDEIPYFDGVAVRVRKATAANRTLIRSREMGRRQHTAVIDPDDTPTRLQVSRALDTALRKVHAYAVKDAMSPIDEDDEVLVSSRTGHRVPIPRHPNAHRGARWTPSEEAMLEAAVKHYRAQAAAYRDNPEPFGKHRSDSSAWLNYFTTAIPTGRHRELLAQMPQWDRHILETCRTSGRKILMPHPANAESLPRYLRVEEIARRFGIDRMLAEEFQLYFMVLELDARVVEHYAGEVRRITQPQHFTTLELAKNAGLHPDVLLIQLSRLARELLALEPDEDALDQGTTPHYDTDIGAYDTTEMELEILEGEEDPTMQSAELIFAEQVEESEEMVLEDAEDSMTEGQYEAIAYHEQGHGDCEADPLDGDPLYDRIRLAKGPEIAALKKELWAEQQHARHTRSHAAWTYLWLILKSREAHFTSENTILKQALGTLDKTATYRQLRQLGAKMYAQSKGWPSYARKKFWAMYHSKKADFEAALKQPEEATATA
ncbi:MAG: hypothetical protein WC713_14435 [Candidatus Methylomirabilota bacterium]